MSGGPFSGKRVLVTGSTRGIGHAAAGRFLAEGATVVLHGASSQGVEKAVAGFREVHGNRVLGLAADLAYRAQISDLAVGAGDLDVLVNCAGIFEERPIAEADAAHWNRVIAINCTAPWLLAKALLPGLTRRAGVIVNVASDAALLGYPHCAAYCASKGALLGLTRALAVELAPRVRALCVCPGPVETDMLRQAMVAARKPQSVREDWARVTLLGRVADPVEIAGAIVFAASADCRFATGNVIVVDGGATAGRRIGQGDQT